MRARTISALYIVIAMAAASILFTGCASPHKEFAYVVGQGTNEVFQFSAKSDGTLVPLGTPNFPAGSDSVALAVHTSGDFLYVADFAGNDVTQLVINKGNGELSVPVTTSVISPVNPINIFSVGTNPIAVAMSPTAPFLYVANQGSSNISAFTVDPGSGSLNAIGTFAITPASTPSSMAISPKGDFLFVANSTQATVAAFAIGSDGKLAAVAGSPFSVGAGATPNSITVEPTGRFLYVTDPAHNAVLGFALQSGALSPITGSPFPAGTQPTAVAVDPQGVFLYAANIGSNNVSAYGIDANTGALGPVKGSPFATGGSAPSAVIVNSNTSVLYVTDQATHDIAALGIGADGSLQPVKGSPFGLAAGGVSITLARE